MRGLSEYIYCFLFKNKLLPTVYFILSMLPVSLFLQPFVVLFSFILRFYTLHFSPVISKVACNRKQHLLYLWKNVAKQQWMELSQKRWVSPPGQIKDDGMAKRDLWGSGGAGTSSQLLDVPANAALTRPADLYAEAYHWTLWTSVIRTTL